MKSAYNESLVYNLEVIKETKRWFNHKLINASQFEAIKEAYKTPLYHPNSIIRVLLFIAALLALSGVTGMLTLATIPIMEAAEESIYILLFLYGIVCFVFVERIFIKKNHFKSGVTEAIIYCACLFTISGLALVMDGNEHTLWASCLVVFVFAAIRYADLICTVGAMASFGGFIFTILYSIGGLLQSLIPFAFIVIFIFVFFLARKLKSKPSKKLWYNNLLVVECLSLLFVYAGGNYLVVRELSVEMMGLDVQEGEDIPFAFLFYGFTVMIPICYLYFGIRNKDLVLLRLSLFFIAFSAFTFKYYYSLGHPEISLTIAGLLLLMVAILLLNYLKVMRNGFTRENILSSRWANANVEAFVISQTMGGNQQPDVGDVPGGGGFGGGGASTDF